MLPRALTLVAVVGRKDPRSIAALLLALLSLLRGCCWLAALVLANNSGLAHDLLAHGICRFLLGSPKTDSLIGPRNQY